MIRTILTSLACAGAVVLALAGPTAASEAREDSFAPVSPTPIVFRDATLTVVCRSGLTIYTPAALEGLGVWRMTGKTPWREEAAVFEGVLFRDLLETHGLAEAPAVRVTAENDYSVVFPRAVWTEHEALIATRVDGRAHSRRARGPLQFVFSIDGDPAMAERRFEQYWVWMASRIEAAE